MPPLDTPKVETLTNSPSPIRKKEPVLSSAVSIVSDTGWNSPFSLLHPDIPSNNANRNNNSPNPQQAIWQHLAYYLSPMCAECPASPFRAAHIEMHEKMKAESASKRLSGKLTLPR